MWQVLLSRGWKIHFAAWRLRRINMKIYAHALPSMQKEAAAIMETVLHG